MVYPNLFKFVQFIAVVYESGLLKRGNMYLLHLEATYSWTGQYLGCFVDFLS